MGDFSCHTEYEMESSKVHHTELSYSTDSQWSPENNREHFELLKKDPQYGRFFRDFDTLMLGEKISAGGQAYIYEARLQPNAPFDLVVKVMRGDFPLQDLQSQWPVGMLSAHSKFKQLYDLPLITILGGTLLEDARFAFVMYRRWGDLHLLINRRMKHTNSSPFPIEQAIQLMRNIAEDMKTLHEKHDILHRDLKASNVLIWGDFAEDVSLVTTSNQSENINTVVADFECSVGVLGTGFWRAPEILQQLRDRVRALEVKFTRESDVYSYGMTCYEIATGCIPFDGDCNKEMVSKVLLGLQPELPQDLPEFLRDMIALCWCSDPSQRPNSSEICEMLERRGRCNPISVSVNNEIHGDATVVKVKQWTNPQPLALLEVIQKLIDIDLYLWEAADSYQSSNFYYQDFKVIDHEGRKLNDEEFIELTRKVLSMPVKIKWITDNLGRSTNQIQLPSCLEDPPMVSVPSNNVVPATTIQLIGKSRPGLFADVSAVSDESLICKVSSIGVWTHKGGVLCVIQMKCDHNVEYTKMACLWDRLFPILQGHDNKQVVERVAAQEFHLMKRNLLYKYSIPWSPSWSSFHIFLQSTERRNDSVIGHVVFEYVPNVPELLELLETVLKIILEDFGYGVQKAWIDYDGPKHALFHRGEMYRDMSLNTNLYEENRVIKEILWGAIICHSPQGMKLSIIGDKMGLFIDLKEFFYTNGFFVREVYDIVTHENTIYVEFGLKSPYVQLQQTSECDPKSKLLYPDINFF